MSAEVRAELAAAVGAVEGVDAAPYYRQSTTPGNAHIRLERTEKQAFGLMRFWNVVLICPQDSAAAEKYLEKLEPQLLEALEPVLAVREIVPQRVSFPGVGDLLCAFINGHREE